jgi:hypothetical protein
LFLRIHTFAYVFRCVMHKNTRLCVITCACVKQLQSRHVVSCKHTCNSQHALYKPGRRDYAQRGPYPTLTSSKPRKSDISWLWKASHKAESHIKTMQHYTDVEPSDLAALNSTREK